MTIGDDTFHSMPELYEKKTEGVDYLKEWYRHRWRYHSEQNFKPENDIFIMAPHGGSIETGTTELALATAGFTEGFNRNTETSQTYDYFIFNGTNPSGQNDELHVTASHYDEPVADELVGNSKISLAFHGCKDDQPFNSTGEGYEACLVGGLDIPFMELLAQRLRDAGFDAYIPDNAEDDELNGDIPHNVINKNKRRAGAQFELTTSLRDSFFMDNRRRYRRSTTNDKFWRFVNAVRETIETYKLQLEMQPA